MKDNFFKKSQDTPTNRFIHYKNDYKTYDYEIYRCCSYSDENNTEEQNFVSHLL